MTCSETVIGAHTILTAAHCFAAGSFFDDYAVAPSPGATSWTLSDLRVDPSFDATTFENDLALLTLREAAPVAPLALDSRALDESWVAQTFTVVGFGSTGGSGDDSGSKRSGTAKVTSVSALDFSAIGDPSQPCQGDSGGPALFTDGSDSVVSGVISHGDSACMDHAVLARVDAAETAFIQPYFSAIEIGAAKVGDRCYFDEQCASGDCAIAADDSRRSFCSQPCKKSSDCPATMSCTKDGCAYRAPSPGALGGVCAQPGDCASGLCHADRCTQPCVPTGASCPSGYACTNTSDINFFCLPAPSSTGCELDGRPSKATSLLAWLLLATLLLLARGRSRA